LDQGPGRLVEHLEQAAGMLAGLESGPPQRRYARSGFRPLYDLEQSPGHAQTDPFGLGDGGKLVSLVGSDLDRVFPSLLERLDFRPLRDDLLLLFVAAGLGRGAVHGVDDLFGLAVQRLP
jgi:hypothetical protein